MIALMALLLSFIGGAQWRLSVTDGDKLDMVAQNQITSAAIFAGW